MCSVPLRSRRSSMDSHFVSLVGVRRRDPGEWRTIIVWAASRSMVPVAEPSSASTHDEHFSFDGTQVAAWASMKNFRAKDSSDEPPSGDAMANVTSRARGALFESLGVTR